MYSIFSTDPLLPKMARALSQLSSLPGNLHFSGHTCFVQLCGHAVHMYAGHFSKHCFITETKLMKFVYNWLGPYRTVYTVNSIPIR